MSGSKKSEKYGSEKKSKKSAHGSKATIREVVESVQIDIESKKLGKRIRKLQQSLKTKEKAKIVEAALTKFYEAEQLKPYQAELIKMQKHVERTGRKLIVLFDGRDASGKGGTIRRVVRYLNEKRYNVVALGKPNDKQRTELHMKRYIEHFPHAGEVILFDRSWYNRAMVEPVMKFCTPRQYKDFMDRVLDSEESFTADGKTILVKLYFSVSKSEQARRFDRRRNDPLRRWKLSEVDLQAQELWEEFTEKKFQLLRKTHTEKLPWHVIRSDDKPTARRETIKVILNSVPYRGRSRTLNLVPDPDIVIPGDAEWKRMRRHKKKTGRYDE